MAFDPFSWAIGFTLSRTANRLLKKREAKAFSNGLRNAVREWSRDLPTELSDLHPDAVANRLFEADREQLGPKRRQLQECFKGEIIPEENVWFEAICERREEVHAEVGDDAQQFFKADLAVAEPHIGRLAFALRRVCIENEPFFRVSVYEMLRELSECAKQRAAPRFEVIARSTQSRAFDASMNLPLLSRERLTTDDFENGDAYKPPRVDEVADALVNGKSLAVKGNPGSGKSAFAAWVHWLIETKHRHEADFFPGGDLQEKPLEKALGCLSAARPIIIIDDVHLIDSLVRRLPSQRWIKGKSLLLIGRTTYMKRALLRVDRTVEISDEVSADIAAYLVRKYVPRDVDREKILDQTRMDLVLTKWILEAVVNGAPIGCTPVEAAEKMLRSFVNGKDKDPELLRLFCVLAAFWWVELWCPERFLSKSLGFKWETIKDLCEIRHESECQWWEEPAGCLALKLLRHPRLCELFLKAMPRMGSQYYETLLRPTCRALSVRCNAMESFDFQSLVLGAAALQGGAELDSIEWRLIYGDHPGEYVNVARSGAELLVQGQRGISALTLEEQIRRLKFAYGAANGERRVRGGQAAAALLSELKKRLLVRKMPKEAFADKGKYLYQEAYILRLKNAKETALAKFRESSEAAEAWATMGKSPLHRGKAAMSRIASAAYRIDLAVFALSDPLNPDKTKLDGIARELECSAALLDRLHASATSTEQKDELRLFRQNALLHLAEAGGWLGSKAIVDESLSKLEPGVDVESDVEAAKGLAEAAYALVSAQYERVISQLKGQIEHRTQYAGEGVGKIAVMLLISHVHLHNFAEAEQMRLRILSREWRKDAGNSLAKKWAAQLGPITGASLDHI